MTGSDAADGGVGGPTGSGPEFDVERVALAAQSQDPGLPQETAQLLARRAWPLLQEVGELDAPALARRLMVEADVGATPANVVATAAVAFCRDTGLQP